MHMQLDRLSGREGVQSVLVPGLLGLFCRTNRFEAQVSVAVSRVDGAFRRGEPRWGVFLPERLGRELHKQKLPFNLSVADPRASGVYLNGV